MIPGINPVEGYEKCVQIQDTAQPCRYPAVGQHIYLNVGTGCEERDAVCVLCAIWRLGIGGAHLNGYFMPFGEFPTHEMVQLGVEIAEASYAAHRVSRPQVSGVPRLEYKVTCLGCEWGSVWHPHHTDAVAEHSGHAHDISLQDAAEAMNRAAALAA